MEQVQSALGKDTNIHQTCSAMVKEGGDGRFCIQCQKTEVVDGIDVTYFDDGGDCGLCRHECLTLLAAASNRNASEEARVLTGKQVCGMCTYVDTVRPATDPYFPNSFRAGGAYTRGLSELREVHNWEHGYFDATSITESPKATDAVGSTPYAMCLESKSDCLRDVCDQCIEPPTQSTESFVEKNEKPCSTLFSGGPITNSDGHRYDCAVRLIAGQALAGSMGRDDSSSIDDDLVGDGKTSGRVEIKHNGAWGTVCGTSWSDTEANVFCKSIGFSGGQAKTASDARVRKTTQSCDAPPGRDYAKFQESLEALLAAGLESSSNLHMTSTEQCMYCTGVGVRGCNLRVVANNGKNSIENGFELYTEDSATSPKIKVDPGDMCVDGEVVERTARASAGTHKIVFRDAGGNGWHPGWEQEDKHPGWQHPSCVTFWQGQPADSAKLCTQTEGQCGAGKCSDEVTGNCPWAVIGSPNGEAGTLATCEMCLQQIEDAACIGDDRACADPRVFDGTQTSCDGPNATGVGCRFVAERTKSYADCATECIRAVEDQCHQAASTAPDRDTGSIQVFERTCSGSFGSCIGGPSCTVQTGSCANANNSGCELTSCADERDPSGHPVFSGSQESCEGMPGSPRNPTETGGCKWKEELIALQWVHELSGVHSEEDGQWTGELQFQCGADGSKAGSDSIVCDYYPCECGEADIQNNCGAPFGQGNPDSMIWLGGINCTGDENSLCECQQDGYVGQQNKELEWGATHITGCANHGADAGVICHGTQVPQAPRIEDCTGVCVPSSRLGDGWCDSGEFNAKLNCESMQCDAGDCSVGCEKEPPACPHSQWQCRDASCIRGEGRCDGHIDCPDKSDEESCLGTFCCQDGIRCIPSTWVSDGWPDCLDASDEPDGLFNKFIYNLNNHYCRSMLPMCDKYLVDRAFSCSDTILPLEGCSPMPGTDSSTGLLLPPQWSDGVCQPLCGTARCRHDGGDCPAFQMVSDGNTPACDPGQCNTRLDRQSCEDSSGQPGTALGQCVWEANTQHCQISYSPVDFFADGKCDLKFNTSECGYDNGECLKCTWNDTAHDCPTDHEGDGFCHSECHTPACHWDGGDCPAHIERTDPPMSNQCPLSQDADDLLGNGLCDNLFNTPECGCDLGDCSKADQPVGQLVFMCDKSGSRHIDKSAVCDGGVVDCPSKQDEENCAVSQVCDGISLHLSTSKYGGEVQFSICDAKSCGPRIGSPAAWNGVPGKVGNKQAVLKHGRAAAGGVFGSRMDYFFDLHLSSGRYTIMLHDDANDGWHGGYLQVTDSSSGSVLVGGKTNAGAPTYVVVCIVR
jgi:hypothetical protein